MPMFQTNNGGGRQSSTTHTQQPQSNGDANTAPERTEAPAMLVPFIRATDENIQFGGLDKTSAALTTSSQDLGINDIPAYGYLNCLYVLVEATGGAAGLNNAVAKEDAPFAILRDISLGEPNGNKIAQWNTGYDMYLADKYGGYRPAASADPKSWGGYSGVATSGNFKFLLRLPVAVSERDGVGALGNQDSTGQFKLMLKVGATTDIYDTAPDTKPIVRVRAWMGSWDQPEPFTGGMANETQPPAHGTISYWMSQTGISVVQGENTIELKRKGNYLRQIIFVLRRSGSRSDGDGDWPSETRFERDSFPARTYNDDVWEYLMWSRTGFTGTKDTAGALDYGVRFHDYMHDFNGALGWETRDQWQPTRTSTRLEIKGNFANAGTLDIIYNDVAIQDGSAL